jgi:hypothetical protein
MNSRIGKRTPVVFASVACVAGFVVVACSDDGTPGTSSGTSGSSGSSGSSGASSGSSGSDAATEAGGLKKNAEVGCTKDGDCESNICFTGGTQSYCALKCTPDNAATVCVAPFTGSCNNKGFCKRD